MLLLFLFFFFVFSSLLLPCVVFRLFSLFPFHKFMRLFHLYAARLACGPRRCVRACSRARLLDIAEEKRLFTVVRAPATARKSCSPSTFSLTVCFCFQNGRVSRAIHHHVTSSLFILTAFALVVVDFSLGCLALCVDLKKENYVHIHTHCHKHKHTSATSNVRTTSGWRKKEKNKKKKRNSRAKNHYFTSRSSTFFSVRCFFFPRRSCISWLYIWANPFNEQLCLCIPMNHFTPSS
jgi:hypothetical protein